MTMRSSKEGINTNMFSKFMLHRIISNLYSSCIVTKKRCGDITRNPKISQQPSKPYNLCSSSKGSKFCLCTRMRYNCLFLGHPCKRRAKKNGISCDGTTICWVTRPSGVRVSMKLERTILSLTILNMSRLSRAQSLLHEGMHKSTTILNIALLQNWTR